MSKSASINEIVGGLTPPQIQAARARGPVLVLAGAGSGKTRCLTVAIACRIAERGIPASRILATTFTNKAAGEMRERIHRMLGTAAPDWIGTFHGIGARQLRAEPETAGLRPGFDILDAGDSARIIKRLLVGDASTDDDEASPDRKRIKLLCDRISRFKDNLVAPDFATDWVENLIVRKNAARQVVDIEGLRLAARTYRRYQAELRDLNAADFGDLIMWAAIAMQHDESFRRRWAGRFSAVLADEFQDVNRAQFVWLQGLARDHREIFVVGDDAQSIYSWRGADVAFIRRFQTDFVGATVVKLEQNFRSTGHILAAANAIIARDESRLPKTLFTHLGQGERVHLLRFDDAADEAAGIAAEIGRRVAEGTRHDEVAILYRANRLSRACEEALLHARIPYVIVGDPGFYQRASVKDALAFLRLSECPGSRQSDEAFRRVANKPARGLGARTLGLVELEAGWRDISLLAAVEQIELPKATASRMGAFVRAIRSAHTGGLPLSQRLSYLLEQTGYLAMLREGRADDAEDKLENVAELVVLAERFSTVTELLEHAALASEAPREETGGRVQLMTMHRAKGLEFPHVFLPAWDLGIFPSGNCLDVDEERRLAYVALTRGMRKVTISHCRFRDGRATGPSVFLGHIPDENLVRAWQSNRQRQQPNGWRFDDLDLKAMGF